MKGFEWKDIIPIHKKAAASKIAGLCIFFICTGWAGMGAAHTVHHPFIPFEEVPAQYCTACTTQGTVERIEYPTHVYEKDGTAVQSGINEAYVYLPYGYDGNQAYNIIYLMHGGGEHAGYWFAQGEYAAGREKDRSDTSVTLNILDQMIALHCCDPLIVVTPCMASDGMHGFNGAATFRYEFKQDLVPAVESRYATFAYGDVSPDNLIKSREHRAYAGLSLGSAAGWSSILLDCTDYVGYVGNFSGCYSNVYAVAEALNTRYEKYPLLYWYNGNGTYDSSHDDHKKAYSRMLKLCDEKLKEGFDIARGENCCFVDKSGKYHRYDSWIADLFNVLHLFF